MNTEEISLISRVDRLPIIGLFKAIYYYYRKEIIASKNCFRKQMKFLRNLLKIIPGIGHCLGLICYLLGWKQTGDIYIKNSSRTLVCIASGAAYAYSIGKNFEDIFCTIKPSKEILISCIIGYLIGYLFDYSTSLETNLDIPDFKPENQILFSGKNKIKLNFPFGLIKNYRKMLRKPARRIKYLLRLGLYSSLYATSGLIGLYYCLKIETNIYSYIYNEFKKYLLLGSCVIFLFA